MVGLFVVVVVVVVVRSLNPIFVTLLEGPSLDRK